MPLLNALEIRNALLLSQQQATYELYQDSVASVFCYPGKFKRPIQCGSGTYITYRGNHFVLTAAHVLKEILAGQLGLGGGSVIAPIFNWQGLSSANQRNASGDTFDVAIVGLSPSILATLSGVRPIVLDNVVPRNETWRDPWFMAAGYPNSKNRRPSTDPNSMQTNLWRITTTLKRPQTCRARPDLQIWSHLILEWSGANLTDINTGQEVRKAFSLRGMSGCPVFDLGDYGDLDVLVGTKLPEPRLAGLLTDFHESESAIVCTTLAAIDELLRSWATNPLWPCVGPNLKTA